MKWVDTHCHLQLDGRPPQVLLDRAPEVEWLVVPGVDLESSIAALRLFQDHRQRISATVGLHPHDATRWGEEGDDLADLAVEACAVGETGLDFYRDLSPRQAQRDCFAAQIDLAATLHLPLVVHCRDAFDTVFDMLERAGVGERTILHCWTGGPRWTRRFLDLGCTFSYAGPIAFPTGDTVRRGAALVPPGRALVETDTPFLTPPPHRGEPNEPAWVGLVGAALAQVWGMTTAEVAEATSANAARIFRP
jgi:TatD DNase family protein